MKEYITEIRVDGVIHECTAVHDDDDVTIYAPINEHVHASEYKHIEQSMTKSNEQRAKENELKRLRTREIMRQKIELLQIETGHDFSGYTVKVINQAIKNLRAGAVWK